jgi:hypothetical protein
MLEDYFSAALAFPAYVEVPTVAGAFLARMAPDLSLPESGEGRKATTESVPAMADDQHPSSRSAR